MKPSHRRGKYGLLDYELANHPKAAAYYPLVPGEKTRRKVEAGRPINAPSITYIGERAGGSNPYRVGRDLLDYDLLRPRFIVTDDSGWVEDATFSHACETAGVTYRAARELAQGMTGKRNLRRGDKRRPEAKGKHVEPLWVIIFRELDALYEDEGFPDLKVWKARLKTEVRRRLLAIDKP